MNIIAILRSLTHPITAVQAIGLIAMIGLAALPGYAVQNDLQFNVMVRQTTSNTANAGLCRSSTRIGVFGGAVTVICSSGVVVDFSGNTAGLPWTEIQDGAYRFVTLVSRAGESLGTVNSYAKAGAVTSWRVVKLANLDYLELMVGW